MQYHVIHPHDLSRDLRDRWRQIQTSDARLASPYFCPEFTQAVAAVRDDVYIAALEDTTGIVGFFPFHRQRGRIGKPIGLGLSDYHGIIASSSTPCNPEALVRHCNLVRWEFDHLIASQRQFEPYRTALSRSPIIDLSLGLPAFQSALDKAGRKQHREAQRKREKLEQACGPLRFTLDCTDDGVLRQLMSWKSLQCRKTGTVDYFAIPWCASLVERLHKARTSSYGAFLSCLHVNETLAAAHIILTAGKVWHSWFPAYNDELRTYSPGLILLYDIIEAAAHRGVSHIDLGKGTSLYKQHVMTGAVMLAEGAVELASFRNSLRRLCLQIEHASSQHPLRPLLAIPARFLRRMDRHRRYR